MKTLFLILTFTTLISRAQINRDSLLIDNKRNIENIQMNFERSHDEFTTGAALCGAGLMLNIITLTGKQQKLFNQNEVDKLFFVGALIEITGLSFVVYSHSFINKASIKVHPTKLTYTFR